MVETAGLALNAGVLLALTVFVTAVLRYELEMGVFVSGLTAVSVTAAGIMAALAVEAALHLPFLWSVGLMGATVFLFLVLYELLA